MKARIVFRPEADRYDIFMFSDDGKQVARLSEDGFPIWETYEPGTVPKQWIVFDVSVYDAIRRAMIGEAIDNDDALMDTRKVRDRLLAMVESEWQSRQLEKH